MNKKDYKLKKDCGVFKKGITKLRMYLDPDKTKNKFDKNRRKFKTYGIFKEYRHGNVIATLDNGKEVEVPIYFTIPDKPENHPIINKYRNKSDKIIAALNDEIPGFDEDKKN